MAPKLSKKQLQDQTLILESLENAGWVKTDKASVITLAELSYRNEFMTIEVEHNWRRSVIFFRLFSDDGDIFFMVEYREKLNELLKVFIALQDKISPANYNDYIRKILKLCPNSFLDSGDDLIPLIDDEDSESNGPVTAVT